MNRAGSIHSADVRKSERLQRVLALLKDEQWHGTREIRDAADVCAVNTIISELRDNGLNIPSRCIGQGRYEYRLIPAPVTKPAPTEQLALLAAA